MADQASSSRAAQTTETTPLLASNGQSQNRSGDGAHDSESTEESTPTSRSRAALIITLISFTSAILTLLFIAVSELIISIGPRNGYYLNHTLNNSRHQLVLPAIVAAIFSGFNTGRLWNSLGPLPLGVNVVVDLLLGYFITGFSIEGMVGVIDGPHTCSMYYPPDPEQLRRCEALARTVDPLLWLSAIFAVILAISHVVLFIMRLVTAYRTRLWRGGRWSIPTGQLTFEFTVKLLRKQGPEDVRRDRAPASGAIEA